MTLYFTYGLTFVSLTAFGQNLTKKELKVSWKAIPNNITECMSRFDIIFSDPTKNYFANKEEKTAVAEFNKIQGMALRNNWKLWKDSVLSNYLNGYKVLL